MFFLCWLPYHVQRLLSVILNESKLSSREAINTLFNIVFYISGYCYYSNSACNPILYADFVWAINQSMALDTTFFQWNTAWHSVKPYLVNGFHTSFVWILDAHHHGVKANCKRLWLLSNPLWMDPVFTTLFHQSYQNVWNRDLLKPVLHYIAITHTKIRKNINTPRHLVKQTESCWRYW